MIQLFTKAHRRKEAHVAYRTTPATREAKRSRREALLRSAHEAVAETGFAAASVKTIAAGASVSAGTVYTYFGSREELLAEVFQRAAAAEFAAVRDAVARAAADGATDGSLTRELTALVHTFARRALAGRTLAWALLIEPAGEQGPG